MKDPPHVPTSPITQMKVATLLAFTTLLLWGRCANAAEYYVCPQHGSDSNSGTDISHPWKTWSKAGAALEARSSSGTTVNVCKGGTVSGGGQVTWHAGHPRTIQAYTAPGSSSTTRPVLSGIGFNVDPGVSHLTFDGIEFLADESYLSLIHI